MEINKSNRSNEADSVIKNHMIWAMGAGAIPIPFADLFAVSAIQLDMIRQLCKLYDKDFKTTEGKAIATTLTGTGLSRIGARAIKFIPGVGSIIGGITLGILSGGTTYALGQVFKRHFESGGTFLDFDPSRLKKYYDEMFEKGKDVAKDIQVQKETTVKNASSANLVDKLKELAEMKKDNIITEEEFEAFKKKLINE